MAMTYVMADPGGLASRTLAGYHTHTHTHTHTQNTSFPLERFMKKKSQVGKIRNYRLGFPS